jgi:hypothetical protein
MDVPARHLLLHAVIVYIVGLLAGFPYGAAIKRGDSDERMRAWRLAHGSLLVGATTMLAIAAVLSHLSVGRLVCWSIAGCSIASGYGFAVALPIAAWVGQRGLTASRPLSNRVVFGLRKRFLTPFHSSIRAATTSRQFDPSAPSLSRQPHEGTFRGNISTLCRWKRSARVLEGCR